MKEIRWTLKFLTLLVLDYLLMKMYGDRKQEVIISNSEFVIIILFKIMKIKQ